MLLYQQDWWSRVHWLHYQTLFHDFRATKLLYSCKSMPCTREVHILLRCVHWFVLSVQLIQQQVWWFRVHWSHYQTLFHDFRSTKLLYSCKSMPCTREVHILLRCVHWFVLSVQLIQQQVWWFRVHWSHYQTLFHDFRSTKLLYSCKSMPCTREVHILLHCVHWFVLSVQLIHPIFMEKF